MKQLTIINKRGEAFWGEDGVKGVTEFDASSFPESVDYLQDGSEMTTEQQSYFDSILSLINQ